MDKITADMCVRK